MKFKKETLAIILLFLFAFFLRVYKLGVVPPSPDWDEAAIGYNAYSVLKTGKDEYGKFLPTTFRSFDDYKPPVYIYLTVPSVAFFGLNVFAVRFPSALLGSLTVLFTFFLTRKVFEKNLQKNKLAFLSSVLLTISPWHLQFSRVGFETNAALFFNVAGAWLFLEGLSRPKLWLLSALSFGLAPYTYHSARVFTPFLILGLILIFRRALLEKKRWAITSALLLILLAIPLIIVLASPEGRLRIKGVSVLADQTGILKRDIVKIENDQKSNLPLAALLHNRRLTYTLLLIDGYLKHFDLKWLFLDGDNPRHHAPGMGVLYLWELPLLLFGIYKMAISKELEGKKILFWWLLVAPIPASPTTELPHALRTLTFLPSFQIFTAYGIIELGKTVLTWQWWKKIIAVFYSIFILFNIIYYFHQYYIHLSLETSKYWQYGYKEIVDHVKKEYSNYDKIVVSKKLEEPHMFFLFYLHYNPKKYLSGGGTLPGRFASELKKFDKFEFRVIDESKEKFDGKTLFIGTPRELSLRFSSIYDLSGNEMARIVGK